MQRNVLVSFGITVLVVVLVGAIGWQWTQQSTRETQIEIASPQLDHQIRRILIGSTALQVEVVNQPASITQGLSGRNEIGADGMLFILGEDQRAHFWMKDMRFDLDLVWLRDGRVVGITTHVPKPSPGTPNQELPVYTPNELVDLVLEVPAGKASEWNIYPGAGLSF